MTVQAIETRYGGCRFRSRLEARTAVAFDHMHIGWEYEPQGYSLPSGRYLPDFRLTVEGAAPFFVEVKGPVPNEREFIVATEVCLYVAPLVIFSGDLPRRGGEGTAYVFRHQVTTGSKTTGQWEITDPEQALIEMAYRGRNDRPEEIGELFDDAMTAGRSARFEHGERG